MCSLGCPSQVGLQTHSCQSSRRNQHLPCLHQDHSYSLKGIRLICFSFRGTINKYWWVLKGSGFIRILAFRERTSVHPGLCILISDRCKIAPRKSLWILHGLIFSTLPSLKVFSVSLGRDKGMASLNSSQCFAQVSGVLGLFTQFERAVGCPASSPSAQANSFGSHHPSTNWLYDDHLSCG